MRPSRLVLRRIKEIYKDVRVGKRRLTVSDVMAIFNDDLPFVLDWTKPDPQRLRGAHEGAWCGGCSLPIT